MTYSLHRVHIVEQPEWEQRECFDTRYSDDGSAYEVIAYCPVGWEASEDYIDRFGTDRWIEPNLDGSWRSRSAAAVSRDILEHAGYKAIVQRSAPVIWPADGQEKVNDSEGAQISDAIRVLKRAGLINGADDLFK